MCLIDTLKNLVFYSKVTIKEGVNFVKQVSKKLNLFRFNVNDSFYLMRTYFCIIRHALKPKHKKIMFGLFIYLCISVQCIKVASKDLDGRLVLL